MTETNKDRAVLFLQLAARGQVQEAYSRFVGSEFKHHNPYFEDSADSLMSTMDEKRAFAEGAFVRCILTCVKTLMTVVGQWSISSDSRMSVLWNFGTLDNQCRKNRLINTGCSK